ncbi:MAG: phosphoglycerate kinase [Gammaproteobacteria bacterium]|nr:phosphoglycerate kinase [Gammaproteobacteria bacterium]
MNFQRMEDLDLNEKRVLIREDLNVPMDGKKIINDTRIRMAVPTIKLALEKGAHVFVMSHLGRPKEGVSIHEQPSFSLAPVRDKLSELLRCDVRFETQYLNQAIEPNKSGITLLENARVNIGETSNDETLARNYARLCDIFIMDAFGTAHRAQASTHGVIKHSAKSCAGLLLSGELDALTRSLENPDMPVLAIIGGAKIDGKLGILETLAAKVDQLMVGGGIANTFLAAKGINIGNSIYEPSLIPLAKKLMSETNIPLPIDVATAKNFNPSEPRVIKSVKDIASDEMILDIGPETIKERIGTIAKMKTIIWNGPVGVFEFKNFSVGTEAIAKAIAQNTGFSIAGGGETISAIDTFEVTKDISYISTGGGAFLEYLEGSKLPSIAMLEERCLN